MYTYSQTYTQTHASCFPRTRTRTHTDAHTSVLFSTHAPTHARTHTHTHTRTHTHTHARGGSLHMRIPAFSHSLAHTLTPTGREIGPRVVHIVIEINNGFEYVRGLTTLGLCALAKARGRHLLELRCGDVTKLTDRYFLGQRRRMAPWAPPIHVRHPCHCAST
jgi:hypothetical protein